MKMVSLKNWMLKLRKNKTITLHFIAFKKKNLDIYNITITLL